MSEVMQETRGSGNDSAESLYGTHAAALYRMLSRSMRSASDTEDVVQTVFERYVRMANAVRIAQPQAFLFAIARNVLKEYWMAKRRNRRVAIDSPAIEAADGRLENAQADDTADRLNLVRQLEAALARLSDPERRVILAVKRDGLSHEETAEATNISLHMVRKHLVDAKAKLMELSWDR
jgi:RNA polymerase sigma factor (sigma-70 family)